MHSCVVWSRPSCCIKKRKKRRRGRTPHHSPPPEDSSIATWKKKQQTKHTTNISSLSNKCVAVSTLSPEPKQKCLSLLFASKSPDTSACLLTSLPTRRREEVEVAEGERGDGWGGGGKDGGGVKINLILQNYQIIWNYGFLVWAFSPCLPSCANQFKQTQRANTRWTPQ